MILDLRHIYKDYNQDKLVVPVLKDVTLQVEDGEYVAIMGPSGSGKTTLMNIIGCLDRPTSGEYYLADQNILGLKDRELSGVRLNRIGFVFQSFHLMPKESALENVALPLSYAGIKKKERKERAFQALERVGLGERAGFMPTQLSGGQKQRVAIARAMVNNPSILLADEPTGALDSKSGAQIMELFQKLNDEGVTIVMITHDRHIAEHAKRIYNIIDGEISEEGREEADDEKTGVSLEKENGTGKSTDTGTDDGNADRPERNAECRDNGKTDAGTEPGVAGEDGAGAESGNTGTEPGATGDDSGSTESGVTDGISARTEDGETQVEHPADEREPEKSQKQKQKKKKSIFEKAGFKKHKKLQAEKAGKEV